MNDGGATPGAAEALDAVPDSTNTPTSLPVPPPPAATTSPADTDTAADHHHHRLIGEKRAVPAEEWAEIRHAYYSEHRDIRSIAKERGLRRAVVRAVVSPWS